MSMDKKLRQLNEQVLERIECDKVAWKRRMRQGEYAAAPRSAAPGKMYQPCTIRLRALQEVPDAAREKNPPRNCIAAYLEKEFIREGEKRVDVAYRSGLGKDEYDNFRSNQAWADEDLLWKLFYGVCTDCDDIEAKLVEWHGLIRRYWTEQVEIVPEGEPQPVQTRTIPRSTGKFIPEKATHELAAYLYARLPDQYETEQTVYQAAHIAPVTWGQLRDNYYRHAWNEGVLVRVAQTAQLDEAEIRQLFELAGSCRTLRSYMMEAILLLEERPHDPDDMMWPLLMQWFRLGMDRQSKGQAPKRSNAAKQPKTDTLEKKVAPILLRWKESEDEEEFPLAIAQH